MECRRFLSWHDPVMRPETIAHLTSVLGWFLATVAILTAWPQAIRLIRTRNSDGVNATTAGFACLSMIAWSGYTYRLGDTPALISSVGPLAAWCTTLVMLVSLKAPDAVRTVLKITPVAVGLLLLSASSSWAWTGGIAAAGSALWALPQLRTALTVKRLEGVSIVSYTAMAAENVGWILYAILTATPAYAAGASIQAPATALIALKARRSRDRLVTMALHPSARVVAIS